MSAMSNRDIVLTIRALACLVQVIWGLGLLNSFIDVRFWYFLILGLTAFSNNYLKKKLCIKPVFFEGLVSGVKSPVVFKAHVVAVNLLH